MYWRPQSYAIEENMFKKQESIIWMHGVPLNRQAKRAFPRNIVHCLNSAFGHIPVSIWFIDSEVERVYILSKRQRARMDPKNKSNEIETSQIAFEQVGIWIMMKKNPLFHFYFCWLRESSRDIEAREGSPSANRNCPLQNTATCHCSNPHHNIMRERPASGHVATRCWSEFSDGRLEPLVSCRKKNPNFPSYLRASELRSSKKLAGGEIRMLWGRHCDPPPPPTMSLAPNSYFSLYSSPLWRNVQSRQQALGGLLVQSNRLLVSVSNNGAFPGSWSVSGETQLGRWSNAAIHRPQRAVKEGKWSTRSTRWRSSSPTVSNSPRGGTAGHI